MHLRKTLSFLALAAALQTAPAFAQLFFDTYERDVVSPTPGADQTATPGNQARVIQDGKLTEPEIISHRDTASGQAAARVQGTQRANAPAGVYSNNMGGGLLGAQASPTAAANSGQSDAFLGGGVDGTGIRQAAPQSSEFLGTHTEGTGIRRKPPRKTTTRAKRRQ